MKDLQQDPALTPEGLLKKFANFTFKLAEEVQPPHQFLAAREGDCDDFATLAADLLEEKGYTPKLVVVFMAKEIHVVCYVAEESAYLDFNNRKRNSPMVTTDGSLTDVAEKVARSFRSTWYCVSEFTMHQGRRQFLYTDFPQMKPKSRDTDAVVALTERK